MNVFPIEIENIKLNIWDTAGNIKYGGLMEGYYIDADVFIIFGNSKLKWVNFLKSKKFYQPFIFYEENKTSDKL